MVCCFPGWCRSTTGGFRAEEAADPVHGEAPTMTTTRMTSGIQVRISTLKISDPLHRLAVVRRTIPNFQNPFELVAT